MSGCGGCWRCSRRSLSAFRKSLSRSELAALTEGLSPMQRETLAALQGSPRMVGAEVLQSRMLRDIYSERQLGGGDDRLLAEPLQCVCAEESE